MAAIEEGIHSLEAEGFGVLAGSAGLFMVST